MLIDDDALAPFRAIGRGSTAPHDACALRLAAAAADPLAQPRGDRVLLAGDWHGNTRFAAGVLHAAARQGISTVVQLGDFGFYAGTGEGYLDLLSAIAVELDLTLLAVDGNHEQFPFLERFPVETEGPAAGLRLVRPRLWHLPRGMRWTWRTTGGLPRTWLAVGGAVSVDKQLRTEGHSWWPEEELTVTEAGRIAQAGTADVVVCHDRPAAAALILGDLPGEWWDRAPRTWAREDLARSDEHSARLQGVIDAVQPQHVWHGHLHQRTEAVVDPAVWDGVCVIHGLAADGVPKSEATAVVGIDGTPVRGRP